MYGRVCWHMPSFEVQRLGATPHLGSIPLGSLRAFTQFSKVRGALQLTSSARFSPDVWRGLFSSSRVFIAIASAVILSGSCSTATLEQSSNSLSISFTSASKRVGNGGSAEFCKRKRTIFKRFLGQGHWWPLTATIKGKPPRSPNWIGFHERGARCGFLSPV